MMMKVRDPVTMTLETNCSTFGTLIGEKSNMRSLYQVIVVDPEGNGDILYSSDIIVAANAQDAERKQMMSIVDALADIDAEIEDLDIVVVCISPGTVRAKKD